ncbi:neuropathy target esterase sws isoform X1 [Cephus cinctus]|uniref:Neuropathy target esterase sws n=1 Tax=Cephus cinctus TaxID=211228 RepID=A0AAJ7CAK6_CEPCN|nr:neuropathy target esterase sws isoform X1 [Cephus cinctus]XP_015605812.1 neuropathy target esterase sws isoform X1 [Cephus cinctus]
MMEVVVDLFNKFNESLGTYTFSRLIGQFIEKYQTSATLFVVAGCSLFIILVGLIIILRKWKNKEFLPEVKQFVGVGTGKPRFRKRDKVLFYGRKMLRKVKSISGQVHPTGQGKKRRAVMRFARRLLQLKKDTVPQQLKVLEPPAEYLEEDLGPGERVPPDALYMLQSIRVFGHFEKPVFLKLCKHTEIMNLAAGSSLFKIGDPDENVFIVQQGLVNVFITGSDGSQISLKLVKTGESVTSLLSFTDVLTGHTSTYKTVSARAVEDSVVVKLPMHAFQEVFQDHPDAFIRVIQVIMVRLQRVTFTALHHYLGLSAELVNQGSHKKKQSPFSGSPVRSRTRESFPGHNADNVSSMYTGNEHEGSEMFHRDSSNIIGSQPVPILVNRKSKNNLDWKGQSSSPQPSQITPDMVPECDSHWSGSSGTNYQQGSLQGGAPDIMYSGSSYSRKRSTHEGPQQQLDEAQLVQIATDAFVKEFGLEDDSVLKDGKVQIREVPAGTYLMKEESHKDVALVYVLSGCLLVSQRVAEGRDAGQEVHMFTAHQGEIVGGLAVLTGEPSFYTIRAKHASRIALLSKSTSFAIMREKPNVVLHVANTVVRRLSPFVRQVDFALDWLFLESGRAVYRQGDESDSTFVVLSGRLRSVITYKNGKKELVAEYGKGDLVGIVEMVTQTPRSTTVMAVRDSELAKLPEGLFNVIKLRYPIVVTRLINLLGHRILGSWQAKNGTSDTQRQAATVDARPSQVNFSTVAIVPISEDVPLTAFTYELYHSLCTIGPCLRLTSDVVRKTLGTSIMEPANEYRLTSWLAQQEDQHRISLYQSDSSYTLWTQRCVRQADCILIVGLGECPPSLGRIEREVERLAMRTQKELVLLHREQSGQRPSNTVQWLNMRSWVSSHHHIQCPKRMFTRRSQYRINELYSKVLMSEPNVHSDFSRLARWLTGTSVGLVLGGGGARGAAHIGMLKAILEAGIPIDMVGGVSIGAFMGALWCMEKNITTTTQKAREWSKKMTQWWRQMLDLTYPMTSMFSGRDFNKTIQATFGDTYIEDLWLPYFTITTDITASSMRTHTHGSLWRYIRGSMSLSGYMPPMCDPIDGHLLLDGGYVNNLPADEMLRQGAHHILAIDVGSQDDTDLTNYGDSLSGWWLLWKRWNPFATPVKVPNLPDIQTRLAYVSCVRQLEEVKSSDYCEYIRPPIDKYKTLQFANFDEIKDVGYQHGKTYFEGQSKAGVLPRFNADREHARAMRAKHQAANEQSIAAYTFTDLAQMVCKVSTGSRYVDLDLDSDSDELEEYEADLEEDAQEVGYASEPTAGILDQSPQDSRLRRRAGVSLSLSDTEAESELEYHPKIF